MSPESDLLRFLVVEEDENARALLVRMLEHLGHRARTAGDGVEAVAALAEERFDFIALNPSIDRGGSQEVVRWLRAHAARHQHLRVIVCGAVARGATPWELGVHAVLPQHATVDQLRTIIAQPSRAGAAEGRRGRVASSPGPSARATPASRAPYFVTAKHVRLCLDRSGGASVVTGGPFHAKAMGTSLTACGESTTSWTKLWDIPFPGSLTPLCARCCDVVAGL